MLCNTKTTQKPKMKMRIGGLLAIFAGICLFSIPARFARAECSGHKTRIRVEQITEPVTLAEGPHWDDEDRVLYFVDIPNQKLLCYDPATGNVTSVYIKNGQVGVAIPVAGRKNKFIAGAGTDFVVFTWDPKTNSTDPEITVLATVDGDRNGTRFNDGKIDPSGRFWGGTMGINAEPELGSLYRIDSNFEPRRIVTPVSISNGLTWSHDNKTFYYIDSPTKKVNAYDYNEASGDITRKRVIFDFTKNNIPGVPDGMTIDTAGNLWIASNGGGRVLCVDPNTGELLRSIEIPAQQVSSVAFGGPNHDILYVTTGRERLKDEDLKSQPKAGAVFAVKGLGVRGKSMLNYEI